ncbi:MAG TPA: hypothetical protein VJT80_10740 [Steroidobacteraceae bacterium]|nr:hypothetical protein [Steroidobacteraceae bacterium]
MCRRVLSQGALASGAADTLQNRAVERQSVENVFGAANQQDLLAGLVEFVQSRPLVAGDRRSARRSFEQATRRTQPIRAAGSAVTLSVRREDEKNAARRSVGTCRTRRTFLVLAKS